MGRTELGDGVIDIYDDCVVVFRVKNFDHAFQRAVEIGPSHDAAYKNTDGQNVRWVFVKVVNVDWAGKSIDGKEVGSKLHYRASQKPIPFRCQFTPKLSTPEGDF